MWVAQVVGCQLRELQRPASCAANPQPDACGTLPPPELSSRSVCSPRAPASSFRAEGRPPNVKMSVDDEQQEQTIAEDLVVTKYKMGGDIANSE